METMEELAGPSLPTEDDRIWYRIGQTAGYGTGIGFLIVTALYLLDATGVLGAGPQFHRTAAGPLQDEANFWAAVFAHQHKILWDIIARDTLGPLASVALIVVGLAIRRLAGDRPWAHLMYALFLIGGVVSAINSLLFLGNVEFWRITGWGHSDPTALVAVGRASVAIDNLTYWPEAFGYVILAGGLASLGKLCRPGDRLPSWLGPLAYLEGLLLLGLAIAEVIHTETAFDVLGLLTGVLIAPALGFALGRHFGRLAKHPAPMRAIS